MAFWPTAMLTAVPASQLLLQDPCRFLFCLFRQVPRGPLPSLTGEHPSESCKQGDIKGTSYKRETAESTCELVLFLLNTTQDYQLTRT